MRSPIEMKYRAEAQVKIIPAMRRSFCNALRLALVVWGCSYASTLAAANPPRGGHVQWARLKTNYRFWSRHSDHEYFLLEYLSDNTSLDIDPKWATADLADMKSLTAYPFVYAEGIQTVTEKESQQNLREFLLRGGFLLIDACINPEVNPDPDIFFSDQVRRFHEILPKATIRPLPADHEIYRSFFKLKELPHSFMNSVFDARWAKYPLYTVEMDGHVVSIISLAALKCGWSFYNNSPDHRVESMKMLVNIYAYALTR